MTLIEIKSRILFLAKQRRFGISADSHWPLLKQLHCCLLLARDTAIARLRGDIPKSRLLVASTHGCELLSVGKLLKMPAADEPICVRGTLASVSLRSISWIWVPCGLTSPLAILPSLALAAVRLVKCRPSDGQTRLASSTHGTTASNALTDYAPIVRSAFSPSPRSVVGGTP